MKILFLIPPEKSSTDSYTLQKIVKNREFRPKLGILYVAGYLRDKTGIIPEIIDCIAKGFDYEEIVNIIKENKPDVVGMSVLTFNLIDCLKAADIIKSIDKNIKICFGGFHPTLYPKETCTFKSVDFIVMGEGEKTFSELIEKMQKDTLNEEYYGINGLGWKDKNGNVIINDKREPITDLDEIPLPAHDLIDLSKYTHILSNDVHTAYMQTSRGCPFGCIFCDMRKSHFRSRSAENILKEIKVLYDRGIKEIFFLDDTITVNKKRIIELCKAILNENIKIKYKISSRVNTIDEEMLGFLKKSGCYRIHYGVESGSQRILDNLEKGITINQIIKAFEITKRFNIDTYAYMMIGSPSETMEDFNQSLKLIKKIKPDYVTYSLCTPFPKTKLYQDLLDKGYYKYDYWLKFAENPTTDFKLHYAHDFPVSELRRMQSKAMAHFYRSPRFLLRELNRTKSFKQLFIKIQTGYRLLFG
ncbi:MAG: radical SAM protein [bacterium]|nr:radical SAM protein [bacterium]